MISNRRRFTRSAAAAGLAASSLGVLALVAGGGTVHADPAWEAGSFGTASTRVGVGSDTIQNLFDQFSGADTYPNGTSPVAFQVPVHSSAATGSVELQSFDAFQPPNGSSAAPGCIVAKVNGATFDRPNGSGAGINALNDANSGTLWEASASTTCTHAQVSLTGQVDFARSSRGPVTAGSTDTWIPFARDAISFVYYNPGAPASDTTMYNYTSANLIALYNSASGTTTVTDGNGVTHELVACIMQANSGTRLTWDAMMGNPGNDAPTAAVATATGCGAANASIAGSGTMEENNGNAFLTLAKNLVTAGSYPAGTWFVAPFSVGVFQAQANQKAPDFSATLRSTESAEPLAGMGAPDGNVPLSGAPGTFTFNSAFYHSTKLSNGVPYGRNLYVVVPTAKIPTTGGDKALKDLFVGGSSEICAPAGLAQTDLANFGFDALNAASADGNELACGDTSTQGAS